MKRIILIITALIFAANCYPQRIKDVAYLTGNSSEQIVGYGLVIGLSGTGDSHRSSFTIQSITSMLKRFGITVPEADLKTKNVAGVMVTASINSYLKPGAYFDVTVSSIGDASGLQGGTLIMTPLSSMAGTVYGFAQGPLSVGGYSVTTPTGNRISRNHALAGRVPRGGILKIELENAPMASDETLLYLREPDMTTANNIVAAINAKFGENTCLASDPAQINIKVPAERQANIIGFLSELENIAVLTDYVAKVVLNERTGTVVAGSNVKILPASISHGSLNITIRSYPVISQPGPFSNGTTEVFNNMVPYASQDSTSTVAIQGASNVQEVAAALNSLKVTPKDIIAIFQALKEAGALVAETGNNLIVMELKITNSTNHFSTTPEISDINSKTSSVNDEQRLAKAARDFETLLTSMMLKSMTSSTEGGIMGEESFGGDYFDMIFQQEMASKFTEGKGLGIAEILFQKLTGKSLKEVDTNLKFNNTEYDPVYNIDKGLPSLQPSNKSLKRLEQYEDIIQDASNQYGVSPTIIKSVILTESAANENAKSSANAKGLMQLIDSTASDMGVNNVWDTRENIMGGTKYLSKMLRQYDGDLKLALAGYNAGPGNVQKYNGVPPFEETQKYITRVMSYMNHLTEGTNEA